MKKTIILLFVLFATLTLFADPILSEGFETWPPTGWTLDPADGTGAWVQNDGTSHGPGTSYEGTNAAMFDNYGYSTGTTGSIITPSLDLTAMSSPVLSFYWWNGDSSSNPATLTIATTTNGTDWTDALVIPVFGTTDWANVILPLATDVTGVKFIALSDYGMKNTYLDAITIDEAPANPVFAIEPDSVGFGTVNVNSSSDMQEFTISNTSGGNLIIDANISITGDDAADFVLTDTNTYPINLGLNEVATIGVAFAPLSDGEKSAFLSIVDNITRTTHEIPLTGEGFQLPADLVQIGNGVETNTHLPIEPYYGYSYSQSIYLASDFGTIAADQRISKIYYNYHWTSNGNADDNDWVIYMGTTAMTEVDSVWTPIDGMTEVFNSSVGLDAVENGDGWLEITLSTPFIYNPSDGNLMIAVDENSPSYSSGSDEFYCSEDTRANVSRYYYNDNINLDPTDPSTQAGTVSAFYPNARFQFEDIPAVPQFAVAPESFDFGQTNVGVTSDAQTFTLMNNGQGPLTINSVTLDNDANFILTDTNSYPVELTDNTITFDVAFAPTEAIDYSANVIVTDNQRVEHLIPITGLGYVPPVGDTIENPFVVAFTDGQFIAVDSTNYMNDDYDLPGSNNNDAVYQFTLAEDMIVDVSLLGSTFDTKLAIYADSTDIEGWVPGPANYLFYDDDYSGKSASSPVTKESKNKKGRDLQSAIYGMPLTAGTYFAIVDGYGSSNGVYNIEIDATIPTVLNPPQNLTADVENSNVTLTWEAPAIDGRDLTGFNVYKNGTMIQEITDPAILTYTDENVANGTYEYYVTATYTDGESDPSNTVEVTIDIVVLNSPENLTASVNEQDVTLNWDAPSSQGGLLQWDDGINYTAIGANGPFNFDVVSRFEPADLANYGGLSLTQISFFANEADCVYSLKVWQGGHAIAGQDIIPGTLIAEQAIDTANLTIGDWNTIVLDTPITIDASQELWFGYNADTQVGFPAGCDAGPAIAGKGDIIYDAEDGWATLSALGLDYNWNIQGLVEGSAKNVAFKLSQASKENVVNETRSLTGYKLYRNDVEIATITNPANLQYVDQSVEPGDYTYYVTAIYDEGESDPSNTVDVTVEGPVYNPPENLAVTLNNHNAVLQWDAPGTGGGSEDVNEGFESGAIPTDWTTIDADGDTYNWGIAPEGITAHSGDYCVLSSSYINNVGALTPDNYLITPQIQLGTGSTLDFWECAQDPAWAGEHYYVKVSTTGTEAADFTDIVHDETLVDGDWHEINVDLSAYDGQNVYIAFEHCEVTDMFAMKLDDIVVSGSSKTINFTFNTNSSKNIPVMNITKSVEGAKFFAEMTNDRQNRDLTGYKVYRNGTMIQEITDPATLTYTDLDLANGTYEYYVTATYTDGESDPSNTVEVDVTIDSPVGDTIENPFVVAFTDGQFIAVDSTNYMNDDYDLPGPNNNDAVYQFILDEDITVDVSLLGSAYDTKLAIYADSTDVEGWVPGPANYLFYNDDYSGKSASSPVTKESKNKKDRVLQSAIYGMPLTAGTYFAIVDGWGSSNGVYTIEIDATIPNVLNPPENLTASVNEQDVTLNWDAPAGQGGLLQWDDGINYTAIGANGPFNFDVVSRFEPADLANYDGLYLTQISFFPNEADCVYSLKVWQGGHAIAGQDTIPGTLLAEQAIDTANLTIGDWNTIVLDTPITIDASQELWFGYNADTQVGYPAGCDAGPAIAGKGDIIYDAEDGWATLSGLGLNYNWNIAGIVEGSAKNVAFKLSQASKENVVNETRALTGYKLYRNDVEITTITDLTNLQYVDQGVEPGDYTYYVTAIYDEGESDASNTVDVTVEVPVYNPPENLTVTVNNHNAVLQWDAPGTGGGSEDVNEGFESGVIPTDWTIVDADGDTYNWDIAAEGIEAHSGDHCVLSSSYINNVGALTPDNYLITPQIQLGTGSTLDFWECAQDPAWAGEHYYVKVSTTGTDPADFTNIIHDETLVDGDWHEVNVSLADYAGQNIYIAFEHCEVTDMFAMKLDDIVVSGSSKTINFTFNTNSSKNIPVMNITKSVEGAKFFAEMTNDRQNRELTGFKVYRNDEMIHEIDNAGASNYIDVNLPDGDFTYYVTAMYGDNESVASNSVTINIVGNNDVNNNCVTSLSRNYPNPFNPETTISYSLKDNGFVSIEVYNVLGQKVKTLVNNNVVAGPHKVTWKGHDDNNKNVSSGIYFYRMKTGNYTSTKKMILMK